MFNSCFQAPTATNRAISIHFALTNHPSSSGEPFTVAGSSCSFSLTAVICRTASHVGQFWTGTGKRRKVGRSSEKLEDMKQLHFKGVQSCSILHLSILALNQWTCALFFVHLKALKMDLVYHALGTPRSPQEHRPHPRPSHSLGCTMCPWDRCRLRTPEFWSIFQSIGKNWAYSFFNGTKKESPKTTGSVYFEWFLPNRRFLPNQRPKAPWIWTWSPLQEARSTPPVQPTNN